MSEHITLQPNLPVAESTAPEGVAGDISQVETPPVEYSIPSARAAAPTAASRGLLLGGLAVGAAVIALVLFFLLRGGRPSPAPNGVSPAGEDGGAIPVNIIVPRRKTLVRTFDQPGSIEAYAKVELYAKASGYLRMVARDLTPPLTADLVAQQLAILAGGPAGGGMVPALHLATVVEVALWQAPEKDFGSPVHMGELLLAIDAPELQQDVTQKEAIWKQRAAELEAARTALATFQAQAQAVDAQRKQAEADVKRAAADHTYYSKQLTRLKELVRRETIAPEVADEKLHQVEAAQAAWESSNAKVLAAQAEQAVVSSRLATAKADLRVREAQLDVAVEDLHRAEILAGYANVYAPFDGMITQRAIDEGDFIQNSTSGQTRLLMTVAAVNRVKAVLQIPEREAVWVQPGAEAIIHVDARSRWSVQGRVARVAPALDIQSRTMRVEIDLPNGDHKLKPGMYGQVTLILQKIENALAIPATAVYSRGGETYIIEVADGVARRQRVRIAYDDGQEVVVARIVGEQELPLTGAEVLVVSNKGELREGQRVRATMLTSP